MYCTTDGDVLCGARSITITSTTTTTATILSIVAMTETSTGIKPKKGTAIPVGGTNTSTRPSLPRTMLLNIIPRAQAQYIGGMVLTTNHTYVQVSSLLLPGEHITTYSLEASSQPLPDTNKSARQATGDEAKILNIMEPLPSEASQPCENKTRWHALASQSPNIFLATSNDIHTTTYHNM